MNPNDDQTVTNSGNTSGGNVSNFQGTPPLGGDDLSSGVGIPQPGAVVSSSQQPEQTVVPSTDTNSAFAPSPQTPEPGLFSQQQPQPSQPQPGLPPIGQADSPAQPAQYGGSMAPPVMPTPTKGKSIFRNKIAVVGIATFILLAGAAGYVFGFYLPNTPERVWNTGMTRTGDQVDTIIETFADPSALETFNKNQLTANGTLKGTSGGEDYSVSVGLDTKYDDTNTQSSADVGINSPETGDVKVGAELKTQLPEGAVIPNIYFKLTGLSDIEMLQSYLPTIGQIDNTWIAIEQDFITEQFSDVIEGLEKQGQTDREGLADVNQQDVISISNDVNAVIQEYVFTADPEKAVIVLDSFVGTEESEGITANHYKAKINPDNSKKLCSAMADKLAANSSLKKFFGSDAEFDSSMKDLKNECENVNDELDVDKPFDLWIDKKYKLLHKIRVYEDLEAKSKELATQKSECIDKYAKIYADYGMSQSDFEEMCDYLDEDVEEGEIYTEVGQVYKGGDSFVFFTNYHAQTNRNNSEGRAELRINSETLAIGGTLTLTAKEPEGGDTFDLQLTIETTPYDGEIDASKPEGAKSIEEVMQMLLGDSGLNGNSSDADYYYPDSLIDI